MPEIKDRIEQKLLLLLLPIMLYSAEKPAKEVIKSILSIKIDDRYEITIVDRKAELPDNSAWHKNDREFEAYCAGRNDPINAGWIKEVK